MAQVALQIQGSVTIGSSACGCNAQNPAVAFPVDLKFYLEKYIVQTLTLTSDSPVDVNLGQLTGVNFVLIQTKNGSVRARMTSAQGTDQAVPVDKFLLLQNENVDITAIDLTREATVDTEVYIVLGQKA